MIASKRQAPRHGPGKLVVDGAEETLVRTARLALKPSKPQAGRLHGLLGICREVYNAALQHRRDAYRTAGASVSWQDQFTALPEVREVRPDAFAWGVQPLRATIKRVDEAMQGFFRRVADGRKAAAQADDWARQAASELVAASGAVALEDLDLHATRAILRKRVRGVGTAGGPTGARGRGFVAAAAGIRHTPTPTPRR